MSHYHVLGSTILGDAASDAAADARRRQYIEAAGTGISAASEWVQQGLQYKAQQDAAKRSTAEEGQALARAVGADRVATDAAAKALYSGTANTPTAAADRAAATLAAAVQDQAGAGLSPENQRKRGEEALKYLSEATAAWQAAAKDPIRGKLAELRVQAAQATVNKIQGALAAQGQPPLPPPSSGFLSPRAKKAIAIGGATVGLGVVGLVVWKLVKG